MLEDGNFMKYILLTLVSWLFTKIIYNYTNFGMFLRNVPINSLFVKTIILFLILIISLMTMKILDKLKISLKRKSEI